MNSIEDIIRKIVNDELDKRLPGGTIIPIAEFCKQKNISRTTLWKAEKSGKLKLVRIGRKVFVNENIFLT